MGLTYKDAGVDIDAGAELVERIKPLVKATQRPEVLGGLGGFAGLCALPERYRDPILVSGTDGTGTKLVVAIESGRHDTIGIDLVAMCVNDIAVTGAEPLLFLDYFVTGALDVDVGQAVIGGIAAGCKQAGCALVGGETAEHPGMYRQGEYDLAGFCVGVVERDQIRDGRGVTAGDVAIGIPSSGLHSNGYSLARKAIFGELGLALDDTPALLGGRSVADALLEPTRIYARDLLGLSDAGIPWRSAAHITGGGLTENIPRALPDGLGVALDPSTWDVPPVFDLVASAGVDVAEMRRTFNMGIGMVILCPADQADAAAAAIEGARRIGAVEEAGADRVRFA